MRTILAVAAEGREFAGILRRAEASKKVHARIGYLIEAAWKGERWILAANGPGPNLARIAMRNALEHVTPDAVISIGFCGALAPSLAVAAIVAADTVCSPGAGDMPARLPQGPAAVTGRLWSEDRIAVTAEEKQRLHAQGYIVVEMEAAAVAGAARESGLPFYCVRVVSDTAGESMPLDLNQFRTGDGHFRKTAIAARAIGSMRVAKDLMRLNRQCQAASEALGEFLANCRFIH